MAEIISVTTSYASGSSPQSPAFPTHAVGDLLMVCVAQDVGGTTLATASTGWAFIGTQAASAGARQAWAYKVATGTSGEDPSITGAADEWVFTMYVIRDQHASPFGSLVSGTDFVRTDFTTTAGGANSGSLTTTTDGCLLLYSWCLDAGGTLGSASLRATPGALFVDSSFADVSGANQNVYQLTGHIQQWTAAAAPTVSGHANIGDGGNSWVIAVRNVANGNLQKDCRTGAEIINFFGNFETSRVAVAYNAPSNLTTDLIGGIAPSTTAATITHTTADAANPPGTRSSVSSSATPAVEEWVGVAHAITSTDMTGAVFSVDYVPGVLTSPMGAEGCIIVFSDGTNWVAYRTAYAAMSGVAQSTNYKVTIALGAATIYDESASAITWSAVTKIGYFYHRVATTPGGRGFDLKNAMLYRTAKVIGGNSDRPAQISYWPDALVATGLQGVQTLQGSGQTLGKSPLQIGDGTTPTYFDLSAQSFEYPPAYDGTLASRFIWNVNASAAGVTIYASASDTILCSSGVLATSAAQPLVIHASSSASATYSFNGTSLVGWNVTDNVGLAWIGTTFKSGGTVTISGGGDLTNCSVTNTTSTNAALAVTANGSVLDSCTIDGTGAAYALELGTAVTAITLASCTMTAGSLTPFDKVHVLKTTGTVTITISGTTSLVAGDVTSAGATVSIAGPTINQKVTVSGITTGARVQIYDTTSSTELFNGTATAGDTVVTGSTVVWTDPAAASADRAIRIRVSYVSGVTAKNFIETSGLTCGQTSGTAEITYPVSPTDDTVYNANGENGSTIYGGGEITFVDASPDRVDMNMTAATLSLQKQYAAWVYYAFTATGIATDIDYINAIDTANYEFTNIRWKNTATAPATLSITGGYAWDSSTGLAITLVDTSGGTIFLMPDHVVAYATGSGVTAQDVADIAAASATSTTTAVLASAVDGTVTLAESLRLSNAVLGGKVSGAGTTTETFRDLADTKDRAVFTVDSSGNRTAVTRDLT